MSIWFFPHPDEEVDHEENVEGEVDLLRRVLVPRDAVLNTVAGKKEWEMKFQKKNCIRYIFAFSSVLCVPGGIYEVNDEGCDREYEDEADQDPPGAGLRKIEMYSNE